MGPIPPHMPWTTSPRNIKQVDCLIVCKRCGREAEVEFARAGVQVDILVAIFGTDANGAPTDALEDIKSAIPRKRFVSLMMGGGP